MNYYCNHCGAVLDNEKDTCTVCGCRGGSSKIEESPLLFHREKHSNSENIRLDPSAEAIESETPENENDAQKDARRMRRIYDLGMVALVVLIVIVFMVMTTVTTK